MPLQHLGEVSGQLAEAGSEFHRRGWMLGTSGNLSAIVDRNPLTLAITRSGCDKGRLTGDQIVTLGQGQTPGPEASAETPLHWLLVESQGAGAVFHTHSVWSTLASERCFAEGGAWIEGYEMLKGLEGVVTHEHREWIPILENAQDMAELSDRMASVLDSRRAPHGVLIRRHGLYTWGADIAQARRHVEILEFLFEVLGRSGEESWQH
jgi:methylthioribulose-1-phosphate dehydratase